MKMKCAQRCRNTQTQKHTQAYKQLLISFQEEAGDTNSDSGREHVLLLSNTDRSSVLCIKLYNTEFNFRQQINILNEKKVNPARAALFFVHPRLPCLFSLSLVGHISFPANSSSQRKEKRACGKVTFWGWREARGILWHHWSLPSSVSAQTKLWSDAATGDWHGRWSEF